MVKWHKVKLLFFFRLVLLTGLAIPVLAQPVFPQSPLEQNEQNFLTPQQAFQLEVLQVRHLDDKTLLRMHWYVAEDYYLYKHSFGFYYSGDSQWQPLEVSLPPSEILEDQFFGRVEVYTQDFSVAFAVPLQATKLIFVFQGCAEKGLCYAPYEIEMTLPDLILSEAKLSSRKPTVQAIQSSLPEKGATISQQADVGLSLWTVLFFALLGGLILNLMPCVFPILSLKILSIVAPTSTPTIRRKHALAYLLGVETAFLFLAVSILILRAVSEVSGWGFHLQNPVVVTLLTYVMFILGLSLSGAVDLSGRYMGLGQSWTSSTGRSSSFATGLLAVVVASPCVVPFMGVALTYAMTQPAIVALPVFLFLGLGLALPLVVISWIPGLSKWLPRPGPWLKSFREWMAVPLYATAIWLAWILGRISGSVTAMALVACGCLLCLIAVNLWRNANHISVGVYFKRSISIMLLLLALSVPWGISQKLLVLSDNPSFSQSSEEIYGSVRTAKDAYVPYTPELLQQALAQNQAVFIKVGAAWCLSCLANETLVLGQPSVKKAFRNADIFLLKADWTHAQPETTSLLRQFNRFGVPLYLFYAAGQTVPTILPEVLSPSIIFNALSSQ